MIQSILLIGLGRFGRYTAKKLNELNHEVMAVDKNEERVNKVLNYVTNAQIGDSTNLDFMESLGVRNFDVCIINLMGDECMKEKKDITTIICKVLIIFFGVAATLIGIAVMGLTLKLTQNLAVYGTAENKDAVLFLLNCIGIIFAWPTGLIISVLGCSVVKNSNDII